MSKILKVQLDGFKTPMQQGAYFRGRFVDETGEFRRTINVMGSVTSKNKPYVYIDVSLLEEI